jgi:hypothetical protein
MKICFDFNHSKIPNFTLYGTLGSQKVLGSNPMVCKWNSYANELDLKVPMAC